MQVRARLKNFRMSPRKVRLVADMLRGKETKEVQAQLRVLEGKASEPMLKLVNSAIANAVNNYGLSKNNLYIERIKVDEGKPLKRWMPRAHGRAYPILKRSCHIELIINEVEEGKDRVEVKKKKAKMVSYSELKKAMQQADKILEQQKGKLKGGKKEDKKGKDTSVNPKSGAISKLFRRKSI